MNVSTDTRSERYLRFSRGSMATVLALVVLLGALCLGMALRPEVGSWWMVRAGWVFPVVLALVVGVLQRATLRGDRWNPDTPEARAILDDEWRRANLDRAMRIALIVVLIVQVPLGYALAQFADLPALRALMAMATATTTIGMVVLIALFLVFDRDARDDG